ncbi:MAG: hypothetical protein RLZ45_2554 [Verrucomicrobiota bacterium]|jgi:sugar phosphate isomerase/epimerase
MSLVRRRRFLKSGLAALAIPALGVSLRAADPFQRGATPRLRLALAAYSFRDDFVPGKDGKPARMDMLRFVDYCADHGCDGAELTSYYFPQPPSDTFLAEVRRRAHVRGVSVSGTAVGNDFCHPPGTRRDAEQKLVRDWIAHASVLGAPHIRVFAGDARGQGLAEAKRLCVAALKEAAAEAGKRGIVLGIENHGGIVSEASDLLEIVESVGSPWLGINLDTGNFHTTDPYADLARCAPWAVNVQLKTHIHPKGSRGTQPADLDRVFRILRDSGYQGWVTLEFEEPKDPWSRVPEILKDLRSRMA